MVDQNLNKQRANEIFQNIFEEAFLTNNGNPISIEMTKEGFKKHMGDVLSPDDIEEIEKIFVNADENNVSVFIADFMHVLRMEVSRKQRSRGL